MLCEVRNLREIARRCQSGEPLGDELGRWLGASLLRFLEHRCPSVDLAFGLQAPKGGVPWWLEEGLRNRNAALRLLAELCHDGQPVMRQARLIRTAALRYAASAWLRDREHACMPDAYRGTAKELLWRAFKSGAPMPVGERQLRTILGRSPARPVGPASPAGAPCSREGTPAPCADARLSGARYE